MVFEKHSNSRANLPVQHAQRVMLPAFGAHQNRVAMLELGSIELKTTPEDALRLTLRPRDFLRYRKAAQFRPPWRLHETSILSSELRPQASTNREPRLVHSHRGSRQQRRRMESCAFSNIDFSALRRIAADTDKKLRCVRACVLCCMRFGSERHVSLHSPHSRDAMLCVWLCELKTFRASLTRCPPLGDSG